jgi:D-sedoheptulose 7-phosphate isomerase
MSKSYYNSAVEAVLSRLFLRFPYLEPARAGLRKAYEVSAANFEAGGLLYLCGNGGSFADAVHIKGELAKCFMLKRPIREKTILDNLRVMKADPVFATELERGLPVVVLGESHSIRSAFANDKNPLLVYAQELLSFIDRLDKGVVLGISTSGNAQNVIAALTLAKAYGIETISFTGPGGGQMAKLADVDWRVPGDCTPDIQENQLPLYHAYCMMLEAYFFA